MSIYELTPGPSDDRPVVGDRYVRSGYRPGWIWIGLAALLLLGVLVLATGFIFGGYNDPMRGYDNGTLIEQRGGDITLPGQPVRQPAPNPEGAGADPLGRPLVRPEEAPALANDGQ